MSEHAQVEVGVAAPDFTLERHDGSQVTLSSFKGKSVVLYFYPKDMTPGCTTQACDFRDHHTDFSDLQTVIIGISTDSTARHSKFIEKYELPFVLLADEDHRVCEQYGVWKEKKLYGKTYMGIERSTFLIDAAGIVRQVWRKVKVKNHVNEALQAVRELQAE